VPQRLRTAAVIRVMEIAEFVGDALSAGTRRCRVANAYAIVPTELVGHGWAPAGVERWEGRGMRR